VLGLHLGVGELGGPFALSALAYLVAVAFTSRLGRGSAASRPSADAAHGESPTGTPTGPAAASYSPEAPATAPAERQVGPTVRTPQAGPVRPTIRQAFAAIVARPRALLGFAAVVLGHTVMVSVMVMTPVHMAHHGDTIAVIGVVISLHILGMYALSPVFGWAADRFGPVPVIWVGFAIFAVSGTLGIADDIAGSDMPRISAALTLLGLGWSACFIAGSTLISETVPADIRVTVQGATDAAMNLGAALFAAAAGPLLTAGGFTLINAVALGIVGLGVVIALRASAAHARGDAARSSSGT
jgi:predicted MFS family arabinose efflux permease